MKRGTTYTRLNIYLDSPELQEHIKIAAARRRASLSAYCLEAIRRRLAEDGLLPLSPDEERSRACAAAETLDRMRAAIGRVGIPVADLVAEGRRR